MAATTTTVGDIIAADEPGFACSKTKLVEAGLVHLRPFNISLDGRLSLHEVYQVPPDEAPVGRATLEAGDILFNNTNSAELVGKSAIVSEPFEAGFSNHLNRIRIDRSRAEPRWFAFWLRKKRETGFFTQNATRWVSQAAFKTSELRRLPIELPKLSEQLRVADLLSRAENIVRMRREAEKRAREIIPALFLDMFGDPATNPKGWKMKSFDALGTLDRGRSRHRPRDAVHLFGGSYPFVQTGDVSRSGGTITEFTQTYSEAGVAQSRLWPIGTLCITIAANIAETGILNFEACFPDSVVGFLPDSGVQTDYIQQWLQFLQPTLAAQAPQAAQKNINLAILRELKVPLPPIALQDLFASGVRRLRALMKSQSLASIQANQAFQSLLAGVFGERKLTNSS
jgi:type I restriction enzyme S subunit